MGQGCQFRCRLLQVRFRQFCHQGVDVLLRHIGQVTVDLHCQFLSAVVTPLFKLAGDLKGVDGAHRGRLICDQYRSKREGSSPSVVPLSELDRIGSRGADRGIMGSGVSDVSVCHFVSDRIQHLQEFGTVGGAVQQGGSKVSGHDRRKVEGQRVRDWSGC